MTLNPFIHSLLWKEQTPNKKYSLYFMFFNFSIANHLIVSTKQTFVVKVTYLFNESCDNPVHNAIVKAMSYCDMNEI